MTELQVCMEFMIMLNQSKQYIANTLLKVFSPNFQQTLNQQTSNNETGFLWLYKHCLSTLGNLKRQNSIKFNNNSILT